MPKLTVLVDSREQRPLLFPKLIRYHKQGIRIETEERRLPIGDYALASCPKGCVIERKGSVSELFGNTLTADVGRFRAALDRLGTVGHPVLVVEQSLGDLFRKTKYAPDPGLALSALMGELIERNIDLWFIGNCTHPARRRLAGELILRAMLAWKHRKLKEH